MCRTLRSHMSQMPWMRCHPGIPVSHSLTGMYRSERTGTAGGKRPRHPAPGIISLEPDAHWLEKYFWHVESVWPHLNQGAIRKLQGKVSHSDHAQWSKT